MGFDMKHAYPSRRVVLVATIVVTFFLSTCIPASAETGCIGADDEVTIWGTIQCMAFNQLLGMLLLCGFLIALVGVGAARYRAISSAVRQSRAYESRMLTALFYGCLDEAVGVADLFPKSPLAIVVGESIRAGNRLEAVTASRWALHRAIVSQASILKNWLWMLSAIGWTSPVVGLVTALASSSRYAGGSPLPLCFGLVIAIPAIWLHRGLTAEVDSLLFETDRMSISIIDQMAEQLNAMV
jgi:biopolymer transport protein ExbB/TolQ